MNILLIGGTGVLSSAVTQEALNKGIAVAMINRGRRAIPNGVESLVADHEDYEKIEKYLNERQFDAIIDFLCYNEDEVRESFLFYAKYTKQYFFISSCAVYADSDWTQYTEDAPKVKPIWEYSVNKWNAEKTLVEIAQKVDCHYTIIRPSVTYGNTRIPYGISPTYQYHWTMVARALHNKPIITWNNGKNSENIMRVEDFAVGVVGLIGKTAAYNEAFNVCGDEIPTLSQVLDVVSCAIGHEVKTIDIQPEFYGEYLGTRRGELIGGRCGYGKCSNQKLKSIVPEFRQTISIKEGVVQTIEAYRNNHYQMGIDLIGHGMHKQIK